MRDRDAPLHIRVATLDHVKTISNLVEEAYAPWIATMGRRPRPMDDNYYARCKNDQARLAEQEGELAGALVIDDMPDHLFLHNIAVAPASQHRGFGRAMMQFVEDQGRCRGYDQVRLTTSEVMAHNVSLYTGLGYVVTHREPTMTADRLWLVKFLA